MDEKEEAFPRGGKQLLTPLEKVIIEAQAKQDVLFDEVRDYDDVEAVEPLNKVIPLHIVTVHLSPPRREQPLLRGSTVQPHNGGHTLLLTSPTLLHVLWCYGGRRLLVVGMGTVMMRMVMGWRMGTESNLP